MAPSAQTLSVVLPVHNAEQTLTRRVQDLLDVLPDLTTQFEVLIVDDGSTDHTVEVALELAQKYPQVQVARHARRQGLEASTRTGVERTSGDVVLVHTGPHMVNARELQQWWQIRDDEERTLQRIDSSPLGVPHPSSVPSAAATDRAASRRRLASSAFRRDLSQP